MVSLMFALLYLIYKPNKVYYLFSDTKVSSEVYLGDFIHRFRTHAVIKCTSWLSIK